MPGGDNSNAAIVTRALERLGLPGIAFTSWSGLFGVFIWKSDRLLFQEYFRTFVIVWGALLLVWLVVTHILGAKVAGARVFVDEGASDLALRQEIDEAMVTEEVRAAAEKDVALKR